MPWPVPKRAPVRPCVHMCSESLAGRDEMAKKDRAAGPRHGSSLGHRRQPVYCAGIDVPVLKMTALVRAFDRVKKNQHLALVKLWPT